MLGGLTEFFFAIDLILTALVLLIFSYREAKKLAMRNWWLVAISTLLIGPSFSLPLYLYLRQDRVGKAVIKLSQINVFQGDSCHVKGLFG